MLIRHFWDYWVHRTLCFFGIHAATRVWKMNSQGQMTVKASCSVCSWGDGQPRRITSGKCNLKT